MHVHSFHRQLTFMYLKTNFKLLYGMNEKNIVILVCFSTCGDLILENDQIISNPVLLGFIIFVHIKSFPFEKSSTRILCLQTNPEYS